jgi:hypothetical protein
LTLHTSHDRYSAKRESPPYMPVIGAVLDDRGISSEFGSAHPIRREIKVGSRSVTSENGY